MKNTLLFTRELENEYQAEFYQNSLRTHRIALWTGIVIFIGFQLLDLGMSPDILRSLLIIRFGIVIPILLVLLVLSYTSFHKVVYDWVSSLSLIITGVGVMAVQVTVDVSGFPIFITSLIIVIICAYTLARLRYRTALITGWILFAVFISVALALRVTHNLITSIAFLAVSNLVGMIGAYFTDQYMRSDFLQRKMLEQERQRSEKLLLNILPTPVAERLKKGDLIADSFEDASILFADIVGFTQWAGQQKPEQVLAALNIIFSHYDKLVEEFNLEKIKTIGDAYMIVGGVPVVQTDHLASIASMALVMQEIMKNNMAINPNRFAIRIGIQCGPVVAGVIGSKKFIYDLWGDTVNTASRLEFSGEPGRIQVSQEVYERLENNFSFEKRGLVMLKGKGELLTYWLTGKKDSMMETLP